MTAASWRRLRLLLAVVVVTVAFVGVLPRIASYEEAWEHLARAAGRDLAALVVLAAWNVASYLPLLVIALPGLSLRRAAISSQVGTALSNTVPAGSALAAGVTIDMYRRWGFDSPAIARALVVTGAWNAGTKLLIATAAVLVAPIGGSAAPTSLGVVSTLVLSGGVAVAVAVVRGHISLERSITVAQRVATSISPRLGRADWTGGFARFRASAGELVTARWKRLTAAAVVSHLSLFAVLLASTHAVPIAGVTPVEVFVVFAVVRVALLVPVTPGGAGLAEVGLAGLLVAAGGDEGAALGAVLVFRAVTWALPIVLGAAAWLVWRAERRQPAPVAAG